MAFARAYGARKEKKVFHGISDVERKLLARRSQRDTFVFAREECDLQLVLQCRDLATQRGLRHYTQFSGLTKVLRLRDLQP